MQGAAGGRGDKRLERFKEQQIGRQTLDFRATTAQHQGIASQRRRRHLR